MRAAFLLLALASCALAQPYDGPSCNHYIGPYDPGLSSHQAALGVKP